MKTLVPDMVPLRGSWLMECVGKEARCAKIAAYWVSRRPAHIQASRHEFKPAPADIALMVGTEALGVALALLKARRPVRISVPELGSW